jgi:hypothetical protein
MPHQKLIRQASSKVTYTLAAVWMVWLNVFIQYELTFRQGKVSLTLVTQ